MENRRLSFKTKVGFAVCDIGGELFFAATGFWLLNYLTDTVGLAAGLAGVVIAIGKIWDAITDPIMGYMSDRTSSRWGRRRPYILFGSLPLFLAMILMFTNPGLKSQAALFVWGAVAFCLLCTAFTVVNIPYNSLTPELTQDYHERSALNGYRFAFGIVGTLVGAGAALPIIDSLPNRDIGFAVMGSVFGGIMFVTALITFFSVREPRTQRKIPTDGFFRTYLTVFKNKPYVLILMAYTMNLTFITIIMGVAIYYFKYILNQEAQTTIGMLILLVVAMVFIPVSVLLSKRVGKKLVYGTGISIYIAGLMTMFFLGHTSVNYSFAILAFIGIGQGFTMAMPYAIVADAVEYDYLLTGKRREGAFYGIWTFSTKVGIAIGLGISGIMLSLTGYIPDVVQTETASLGIRLLLGPIPAVIGVLSIVFLWFYPITEVRYKEILVSIKEMESGKATNEP